MTVKHVWQMSVQFVNREGHTAGLPTSEDGLRQGHVFFVVFFNMSEISEAATIIQACIPAHTVSRSQRKTGQECDLWVVVLGWVGTYLFCFLNT